MSIIITRETPKPPRLQRIEVPCSEQPKDVLMFANLNQGTTARVYIKDSYGDVSCPVILSTETARELIAALQEWVNQ